MHIFSFICHLTKSKRFIKLTHNRMAYFLVGKINQKSSVTFVIPKFPEQLRRMKIAF